MHARESAFVDHASPALRVVILPAVATGEIYIASVTSERPTGGHLLTALALLERDGDDLLALLDRDVGLS
jgi:acyl-CoA dehydrogenase